ncbi:MAG: hypothetical protein KAX49_14795 [Halanaerobiales bacterium]|nr:hypothetical protein [Halanaerobiales bacterium]
MGLYIKKLGGGQVNSITGDFSYSVKEAYLIENGKITLPVNPKSFVGKASEILTKVELIGDDLKFKSVNCLKGGQLISCFAGSPTFLLNNLSFNY